MAKKMKNMTLIDDGGDAGEEDHEDATHDDENTKRVKINVKDSGHMNIFPQKMIIWGSRIIFVRVSLSECE